MNQCNAGMVLNAGLLRYC